MRNTEIEEVIDLLFTDNESQEALDFKKRLIEHVDKNEYDDIIRDVSNKNEANRISADENISDAIKIVEDSEKRLEIERIDIKIENNVKTEEELTELEERLEIEKQELENFRNKVEKYRRKKKNPVPSWREFDWDPRLTSDEMKDLYNQSPQILPGTNQDYVDYLINHNPPIYPIDKIKEKKDRLNAKERSISTVVFSSILDRNTSEVLDTINTYDDLKSIVDAKANDINNSNSITSEMKELLVDILNDSFGKVREHSFNRDTLKSQWQANVISSIKDARRNLDKEISDYDKLEKKAILERYDWDPRLTDEQVDDLISAQHFPGTTEYQNDLVHKYNITQSLDDEINDLDTEIEEQKEKISVTKKELNANEYLVDMKEAYESLEAYLNELVDEHIKSPEYKRLPVDDKKADLETFIDEKFQPGNEVFQRQGTAVIQNYPNRDILMSELKQSVKDRALKKMVKKAKGNTWLKCLTGASGFAAGVGLHALTGAVPVVGGVITIYSGARTLYNASRLACKVVTKINHGNEPKFITKINGFIPQKIKNGAEKLFNRPKNPYLKWFVNGASLGYLADRVFDISGKTKDLFAGKPITNTSSPVETQAPNSTPSNTQTPGSTQPSGSTSSPVGTQAPSSPSPSATEVPGNSVTPGVGSTVVDSSATPVSDAINAVNPSVTAESLVGKSVDLSDLEYGFRASGSMDPVHLMQTVGENAVFDKSRIVDGVEWWHFKQPNGLGYAWFKKDDVVDLLDSVGRVR